MRWSRLIAGVLLVATGCGEGPSRILASPCAVFDNRSIPGGTGTVSGSAVYQKRIVGSRGFAGDLSTQPIRFATVELVRCADGAVVAAGGTDSNGRYDLSFSNSGSVGLYTRVSSSADGYAVSVKRSPAEPLLYGLVSPPFDDSAGGAFIRPTLTAPDGSEPAGAFNILDQGVRGGELIQATTGAAPTTLLIWFWFSGSQSGTAYHPDSNERAITVSGRLDDPDEFDDAVLLHEYGHYAADVYSKDDSPGGSHNLMDTTLDLRLAWSEGWATFFSSVIRNDPLQVDSAGIGVRLAFEIEGPSFASSAQYDTNELAVAAVLWDLFDDTNGDEGTFAMTVPFSTIWNVVMGLTAFTTVSFEDFDLSWRSLALPDLTGIVQARNIELFRDVFETAGSMDDDDPSRANPITVGLADRHHHTLYPAGDVDYVRFTADETRSYTVQTSRCNAGVCDARVSNAADTVLEVVGVSPGGSADNLNGRVYSPTCSLDCPPNDAATLSSRITIAASRDVTYVIKVTRSSMAPPSAGEFGSYDLLITASP